MNKVMEWIESHKHTTFEWGVTDCCLFTCDFVKHMTDIDPAEGHRGHYSTERGSKRAILEYGTIEESFDAHFERVEVNFIQRTDIVYYRTELGDTLGFKWGHGVFTIGLDGCHCVPVDNEQIIAAWRLK